MIIIIFNFFLEYTENKPENLVLIVDGKIGLPENLSLYHDHDGRLDTLEINDVLPPSVRIFCERIGISLDEYWRDPFEYYDQKKKYGDLIEKTRLNLFMLINSFGGSGFTRDVIQGLANKIKSNGGEVFGYVAGAAESAAANMLLDCDKRHATNNSSFVWHMSDQVRREISDVSHNETEVLVSEFWPKKFDPSDSETSYQETIVEEVEQLNEYKDQIIAESDAKFHSIIEKSFRRAIKDDNNIQSDTSFTAKELHKFGFLEEIYADCRQLMIAFLENSGIAISPNDIENPIVRFFIFSEISKRLSKKKFIWRRFIYIRMMNGVSLSDIMWRIGKGLTIVKGRL